MFYVYTVLIPILILLLGSYIANPRPKKIPDFVNLIFKMIPHFFGYTFFLYFLEMEGYIDTGWTFYTVLFYMIPISIIVIVLKIFYFFKK